MTRVLQTQELAARPTAAIPKPIRKVSVPYIPSTGPIGVTVVSPDYAELAPEAIKRFQLCTGLEVITLHPTKDVFTAKLHLDSVAGRPIVFFDVDLWFLRPFDFSTLASGFHWNAVPDPCAALSNNFVGRDILAQKWDQGSYFNSGLFACDLRRREIRQVFEDARKRLADTIADNSIAPEDTTDQFYLNWAVQQQPGLFNPLPLELNFFRYAIIHGAVSGWPSDIIGLHAAGVPLNKKLETLKRESLVFGP